MGLTIHYDFAAPSLADAEARRLVEQLQRAATTLPFQLVGGVLDADAAAITSAGPDDPRRWLFTQSQRYVPRRGDSFAATPQRLFAFSTSPGGGCEEANFGLARYPRTIQAKGKKLHTGFAGWSWSSFCKTQYAARPEVGGVANFLQCHLAIVRLLDCAKELGILAAVHDEGDYWYGRDPDALAALVGGLAAHRHSA